MKMSGATISPPPHSPSLVKILGQSSRDVFFFLLLLSLSFEGGKGEYLAVEEPAFLIGHGEHYSLFFFFFFSHTGGIGSKGGCFFSPDAQSPEVFPYLSLLNSSASLRGSAFKWAAKERRRKNGQDFKMEGI